MSFYLFVLQLTIETANIHKSRFSKGILVKYTVKNNGKAEEVKTPTVKNTLTPTFNFSKIVTIPKLKQENLDFFESGCITLSVYGIQEDTMPDAKLLKLNTRVRISDSHLYYHLMYQLFSFFKYFYNLATSIGSYGLLGWWCFIYIESGPLTILWFACNVVPLRIRYLTM